VITHVNGTGGKGAGLSEKPDIGETELKILSLLYLGLADASIARRLNLGHRTVQRHVQSLMIRLEAAGRVALGARAQEFGLLGRPDRGRCEHIPSSQSSAHTESSASTPSRHRTPSF